jgi:hypothetical protein
VPQRKGSIVLGVSDNQLLLDGAPIDTGHAERGFAQLLTAAGVASVQFSSHVTSEEFERLVRSFSFNGSKAQDFATQIKSAFPNDKGSIRINEVKFVASDSATAKVTADAQSLGPEFKEWLGDPKKLVQLIVAVAGAKESDSPYTQLSFPLTTGDHGANERPFFLTQKETSEALRLLTCFGELSVQQSPDRSQIGFEFERSGENIKKTVLAMLEELSASDQQQVDRHILMRAAEQMAIRYALERFQSGDLKVDTVHQLLEDMSRQMATLRKLLCAQEDKMSKAGLLVESHADLLDRMFWEELPETNKKKTLLSEDVACVPPRNVRQYVELLMERGDREAALAILKNYINQVLSEDRDYRVRVANGLAQLADLLCTAGGNVVGEATQSLGKALLLESDPEIGSLLTAAFVRLGSEANERKNYRAVAQACATMDDLAGRRPGLERELRTRMGVQGRLPEFIEDALNQQPVAPDLLGVLHRNCPAATEQLAERFFRSMRREECDLIVDLVQHLGAPALDYLREMLRSGPQRQAVSSVGLLSRLDVPGLLEFVPMRLPEWNRFHHDIIVRQIAYGAAPDRGRTLLEILEMLDPTVAPQALDEIGMSGDRSASPPLIVMAEAGEAAGRSPLLQLKAIEALGRLREPDAIPVLRTLFESKKVFKWQHHRELRIAAAQALAKIDPRYATQIMSDTGLEPGELAIGPLDSAPACPWVRQRRYERIVLRKSVPATISSSWGRSDIMVRELSLGGGMGTKDDSMRIGSDAEIDIQVGMRHIRGQVLLRRARVNEVGFEFVNTDLEGRHRLRHLLMDSLEHAPENRGNNWNYSRRS